nr:MAG TPA: hypothetical protein [Caudoviricetes sp.]
MNSSKCQCMSEEYSLCSERITRAEFSCQIPSE